MIVKYISGNAGKEIVLNQGYDINIKSCNPYQSSWKYESTKKQYGLDIVRFEKDPILLALSLKFRGTKKDVLMNIEDFFRESEKDIINITPGKLAVGECYLRGYVVERLTDGSKEFYGKQQDFSFLGIDGFWISEISRTFPALSVGSSEEHLDYPYDYPYDYAGSGDNATWYIDHYAPSDFEMIIYGPCIDPRITVAGHPYEVFDTVEKGEYIKVNSRNNAVIKYRTNGTIKDLYDYRGKKEGSLFEKIPSGNLPIGRNGTFGFDLKLFLERSEPAW